MKKEIIALSALAASAFTTMADITVNVSPEIDQKEFHVEYGYLSDMIKPRADRPESARDLATVVDNKFVIKTLPDGPAQYVIPVNDRQYVIIYTRPGDDVTINLNRLSPLAYTAQGSQLMSDIAALDMASDEIMQRYQQISQSSQPKAEEIEALQEEYNNLFKKYLEENPTADAVPYAMLNLAGEDFLKAYYSMSPEVKESPLAIFLEPQRDREEKAIEAQRKRVQLTNGEKTAPDFTFKDVEGKDVSLSDFRGKWVVIDFWGSWCPWCIKGFPKLKEAYAQYKPDLEVLGVACNDTKEKWEDAIKKYELPWVNVYNPEKGGGKILEDYTVEGFPTKAIVNPEGKIVNITVGENPAFFEVLGELLKK